MKKIFIGSRIILGLMFAVFGLDGLLKIFLGQGFITLPPNPPKMQIVMDGFITAKYLMPTVKIIEFTSGILLITNKLVPLALLILTPIVYNIFFLHIFLVNSGLPLSLTIVTLLILQYWNLNKKFIDLLR